MNKKTKYFQKSDCWDDDIKYILSSIKGCNHQNMTKKTIKIFKEIVNGDKSVLITKLV